MKRVLNSLEDLKSIDLDDFDPQVEQKYNDESIEMCFQRENPFNDFMVDSVRNGVSFAGRTPRILKFEKQTVSTIFTNEEAFAICLGAEDKGLALSARRFFRGKKINEDFYNAHFASMQALAKYGSETLSYMMSLPPLPFKAFDAKEMFSEFDRRNAITDIPVFRIIIADSKYVMKFYEDKSQKLNKNIIEVVNKYENSRRFYVSRNGLILPRYHFRNVIPVLKIFLRYSQTFKQYITNYGLETGECSVCVRTLTDPFSIKVGIGPVCGGYR